MDTLLLLIANRNSYALYLMALFPMTLIDPLLLQITPFCIACHIYVVGGDKDFKFGK